MAKTKRKSAGRQRATKRTPTPRQGRPRQPDLPGTEDRAIKPLEDVAAAYADVRDQRMALNKEEHELKATALQLMKKFDKTIYKSDGVEIRIVPGEDDVKVRVKKPGEDDDEAADDVAIEGAVAE
jgi:hypothetical protein